jgi:hypothetical protein
MDLDPALTHLPIDHSLLADLDASQVPLSMKTYKDTLTTSGLKKNGHIFLQHDIHPLTVSEVAVQAVKLAKKKGYKLVTVGECLGQPNSKDWYRK